MGRAKWHATVRWQRARVSLRSASWWLGSLVLIVFWVWLGWPIYQRNIAHGLLHTLIAIVGLGGRAYRYSAPNVMQLVKPAYLTRKLQLTQLIADLERRESMTPAEVVRYQREALQLIASYVRGHRGDSKESEIFVNLLVEDGDDLVVVARDQEHRKPGAKYPKQMMLAWEAIRSGELVYTGDAAKDLGDTCVGKPYKSIMVVPIQDGQRVLGAVSIDSVRRHHFDIECMDLERYVRPYIALLRWTLKSVASTSSRSLQAGGESTP